MDNAISRIATPADLMSFLQFRAARTAALLGVSRNSLYTPKSPKALAGIRRALIVLNGLRDFAAGDDDLAAFWFINRPIAACGFQTAEVLLRQKIHSPADILKALEPTNG